MDKYFATKSGEELGEELTSKIDNYYKFVETSGLLDALKTSHRQYYNLDGNSEFSFSKELGSTGSQGEYAKLKVNHYRNLIQHILGMVTNTKPEWTAIANNTDYSSQAQTILASGLLDYYMTTKRIERYFKKACEMSLYALEGWVSLRWDSNSGDSYGVDPELGIEIKAGDIEIQNHNLLDVIRDPNKEESKQDWYIVRTKKNKYDLAAQYSEREEEILHQTESDLKTLNVQMAEKRFNVEETDDIEVFEFYHARTPSMPEGKYCLFLNSDVVLVESPLPYRNIPLYRCVSSDLHGSTFGYSNAMDLLPIQNAINILYSTVLTNQKTFGVQNIMIPKGSNFSYSSLGSGLNIMEYDHNAGAPQALNLTATPPEIFNTIKMLEGVEEQLSGVNQVSRGHAPASLSGAAMALLHSQSLSFSNNLQQEYIALQEDVGTGLINLLQDYAVTPRVAQISGKHNNGLVRAFKNDDIADISRVSIKTANPVSKTAAGRMELAKDMVGTGLVKTPEQYIEVVSTGRLEPIIEGDLAENMQIRNENEHLRELKSVSVVATDNHIQHIKEHKAVIADPVNRQNAQLVQSTLDHIMEHIEALKNTPPELLQILGMQGLPPDVPQQPTPGNTPQKVLAPGNPIATEAGKVNMPNMPKNPMTGQTYNPDEGN